MKIPPELSSLSGNTTFWDDLERLDPTSPVLLILARERLNQGHPRQALALARRIQTAHPGNIDATLVVTKALADQGRIEEALGILDHSRLGLDRIVHILNETAELYTVLGEDSISSRYHKALEILQKPTELMPDREDEAEESDPGQTFVTETMASLYIKQGHFEQAAAIYRQLIDQEPENLRYRHKLAELTGQPLVEATAQDVLKSRLERLKQAARKRREKVAAD